jgi:hypothetical protein
VTAETLAALINGGAAGLMIIVVWIFLDFIRKRDQEWRDFFSSIHAGDKENVKETIGVLKELINEIRLHDQITRDAIKTMEERTRPVNAATAKRRATD